MFAPVSLNLPHNFHAGFVLVLAVVAVVALMRERWSMEIISSATLVILLGFFQLFPLVREDGSQLDAHALLAGFGDPSLIALLSLLIIGQALLRTEALNPVTKALMRWTVHRPGLGIGLVLVGVLCLGGVMNNTPLVVMVIPMMLAYADRVGISASRVMMPLSFAAILSGMLTLIGSSTNLLVQSSLVRGGYQPLGFFEFTLPGLILAGIGITYVTLIVPRLLPQRLPPLEGDNNADKDKLFHTELTIGSDSPLRGQNLSETGMSGLPANLRIRRVERRSGTLPPPFGQHCARLGDILVVAGPRSALSELFDSRHEGVMPTASSSSRPGATPLSETTSAKATVNAPVVKNGEMLASSAGGIDFVETEAMIPPGSSIIDQCLDMITLFTRNGCLVLGLRRYTRPVRGRPGRTRLQSGDMFLLAGPRVGIDAIRQDPDVLVVSGSKRDVPDSHRAMRARLIFMLVVGLSAFGLAPITITAPIGAFACVVSGCLATREAGRAIDRRILLMIAASLALAAALQASGGARLAADAMLGLLPGEGALTAAMLLFVIVAITTNLMANHACAVLFTPIALELAHAVDADPRIYAITVILAANCAFATPFAYQTNLLVSGPGHYRSRDYLIAGGPLIPLLTLGYYGVARLYYGL